MGVRGIARWSNAPVDGVKLISDSIAKQHHLARSFGNWKADLRTIKTHAYLNDGASFGPERTLWEYSGIPDNYLVIVEDLSAPKRADYLVAKAEIVAHNNAKKASGAPESELQTDPPAPAHYRHTLINFKLPLMEALLDQLGGPWSTQPPRATNSMQMMGRNTGGVTHRLKIDGYIWSIGADWIVRVASVFAGGDQFKGIIMEIEYLPMDNLPYIEGSSAFLDAFTMSLLPSLPSEANFNSVIITDQEWAHVCGVDMPVVPEVPDDSLYAYGDEEELNLDDSHKDDWRRSAYMIVQAFRGEGIL